MQNRKPSLRMSDAVYVNKGASLKCPKITVTNTDSIAISCTMNKCPLLSDASETGAEKTRQRDGVSDNSYSCHAG